MQIGILTYDSQTVLRECPGPDPTGRCPLMDASSARLPCAGQKLLLKLPVVGKRRSWVVTITDDAHVCPVYALGG